MPTYLQNNNVSFEEHRINLDKNSNLVDMLRTVTEEVDKYTKKIFDRYDCVESKQHWDVIDFFNKPEKFGLPVDGRFLENDTHSKYLVEEYKASKEREYNLLQTIQTKEVQLQRAEEAKKIQKIAKDAFEKMKSALRNAERTLPWYHTQSWHTTTLENVEKELLNPIFNTTYSDISEQGLLMDKIEYQLQRKLRASYLNACLNVIENKCHITDNALNLQEKSEKEAIESYNKYVEDLRNGKVQFECNDEMPLTTLREVLLNAIGVDYAA